MANSQIRDNSLVPCPKCGVEVHKWKLDRKKHHCAHGLIKSKKRKAKAKRCHH